MRITYQLVVLGLMALILFSQCSNMFSRKKEQLPEPDRIVFQCNGESFSSDREFIRAMGEGRSRNESNAHNMASLDAHVNLAHAIENYQKKIEAHQDQQQMKEESAAVEWQEEGQTPADLEMTLSGVATICSQTAMDNEFYFVRAIVEIPVSSILENQE